MKTVVMTLWNPLAAGAPVMACQFADAFIAEGYRVHVAHGAPPATPGKVGTVLPRLQASGVDTTQIAGFSVRQLPRTVLQLRRLIKSTDACAVVAFQQRDRLGAAIAGRLCGVPLTIHAGTPPMFFGSTRMRAVKNWVYGRVIGRLVSLIVCTSPVVEQRNREELGIPPRKMVVLWNGINLGPYLAIPRHEPVGSETPAVRMLSVGRVMPAKGHDLLLQSLTELLDHPQPWTLQIVGDDLSGNGSTTFRERLDALMANERLRSRVEFLGWRTDIADLMAAANFYVHPSREEGWPLAVVEALASGLPAVYSDCSGIPDGWSEGVDGYIVRTGDVANLTATLRTCLDATAEQRHKIGLSGRQFAIEHFDIKTVGSRFVEYVAATTATGVK